MFWQANMTDIELVNQDRLINPAWCESVWEGKGKKKFQYHVEAHKYSAKPG